MEIAYHNHIAIAQKSSPFCSPHISTSRCFLPSPKPRSTQGCLLRTDHVALGPNPVLLDHVWAHRIVHSRKRGPSVMCANESQNGREEDPPAMVNDDAIKKSNTQDLSNLISKEFGNVCTFFSDLHLFQGKEQVLALLTSLMMPLGKHIEFVIQPAPFGGLNVGVQWRLDVNKLLPLGKGYSFHTSHIYQGKIILRDVEAFVEPLILVLEKWIQCITPIIEKVSPVIKHKRIRALICSLVTLVIFTASLALLKRIFN